MQINTEDEPSYTIHYEVVFQKYVEYEYIAKLRFLPIGKRERVKSYKLLQLILTSGSGQCAPDRNDSSSDDKE